MSYRRQSVAEKYAIPNEDETYMEIAYILSKRSTCKRKQTGAIAVDEDGNILSSGFNDVPFVTKPCIEPEVGCAREGYGHGERYEKCRSLHAELHTINTAARRGNKLEGAILYSTHSPCKICSIAIADSGFREVVYGELYPNDDGVRYLESAHLEVRKIDDGILEKFKRQHRRNKTLDEYSQ